MTKVQFQLSWQEYYEAERFLHRLNGTLSVPLIRRLRLKQRWSRKPILRAVHYVSVSHDGVHYLLDGIESNLDWNYFQRWTESQTGFFLIYAGDVFNFIPKHAFAKESQLDEFRALLSANLRQQ